MPARETHRLDLLVVGGGVAALWTAAAAKAAGHRVRLLCQGELGAGQSLAAQGVIHGGLKYALGGSLNEASEALAAMPERWLAALRGEGAVDLRSARLLSECQWLWSLPDLMSRVVGFFGSKTLRGRAAAVKPSDYPEVFDPDFYRGSLFRIEEPVVDPLSAIEALARLVATESGLVDWERNARLLGQAGEIEGAEIRQDDGSLVRLEARRVLFAAGAGNAGLLARAGASVPAMQRRPLHQVVVRRESLPDFYSVCVGKGPKPPIVSTSHRDRAGRTLWYLGGELAEAEGVARSEPEQIEAARALLARLLPWIDLSGAEWGTCRVDRAEPATPSGQRPPGAYCHEQGRLLTAWPSKLALAPDLADQVLARLGPPACGPAPPPPPLILPKPVVGTPPWEPA